MIAHYFELLKRKSQPKLETRNTSFSVYYLFKYVTLLYTIIKVPSTLWILVIIKWRLFLFINKTLLTDLDQRWLYNLLEFCIPAHWAYKIQDFWLVTDEEALMFSTINFLVYDELYVEKIALTCLNSVSICTCSIAHCIISGQGMTNLQRK